MLSENVFSEQYTLRNESFSEREKNCLLEACKKYGYIYVE